MGRKGNVFDEAVKRADKDQAAADAEVAAPVHFTQAAADIVRDAAAGNGSGKKHQRGEIRYSVYGVPRGQDVEEYVQSLPTITQVNKWLVASTGLISKLYSAIRIVAEKTRLKADFGDRPLTEAQMMDVIAYVPRKHKS